MVAPELIVENDVSFAPADYEPLLSHEVSLGAQARKLWESTFQECVEYAHDSAFVYTGIGGAPGENSSVELRQFGDRSLVAPYVDLEKTLGHVPKILYLLASPLNADHIINLAGLARTYKEQGVKKIIVVLTALAHERQDHQFIGADNLPMLQVTTLKDVIQTLAQHIDGGLLIQPHSLRPVELGIRYGLPLLPIDPFKMMMHGVNLNPQVSGFVLGPDKGRRDDGRMAASWLGWPMASATKTRDREGDGTPKVIIPPQALRFIKEHNCTVFVFDDEIREGGTIGGLARALDGYASGMVVSAVKPILAGNGRMSAIDHLNHPLIKRVVVTDAVRPLTDTTPIHDKLVVLPLEPEIHKLVDYLQRNLVNPKDPDWLRDPDQTGTLLRLDLSIEQIE